MSAPLHSICTTRPLLRCAALLLINSAAPVHRLRAAPLRSFGYRLLRADRVAPAPAAASPRCPASPSCPPRSTRATSTPGPASTCTTGWSRASRRLPPPIPSSSGSTAGPAARRSTATFTSWVRCTSRSRWTTRPRCRSCTSTQSAGTRSPTSSSSSRRRASAFPTPIRPTASSTTTVRRRHTFPIRSRLSSR